MRIWLFLIILLVPCLCIAQQFAPYGAPYNKKTQNKPANLVVSQINNEHQLNVDELLPLKKRLQIFHNILRKKLFGAEFETKMLFTPILKRTADILTNPDAAISNDEVRYREIDTILLDIGMNPLTALVYEESLRFTSPTLATIQPEKGQGSTYRKGEKLRFAVTASRECFVQIFFVINHKEDNNAALQPLIMSPAPGKISVRLSEGDSLILGEDGSFIIEPPYGIDIFMVVASKQPLKLISPSKLFPFSLPFDPGKLLAVLYGKQSAEKLSIHSCFIVSKPS